MAYPFNELPGPDGQANISPPIDVARRFESKQYTSSSFDLANEGRSLNDIVKGVVGGDQSTADSIISNFISTNNSPLNVREHFFDVLQKWECALPLNEMWLVFFTVPTIVRDELMNAWGENIVQLQSRGTVDDQVATYFEQGKIANGASAEELNGGINLARRKLIGNDKLTKTLGCAFAQAVQIPQEQINTDHVGIPNSRGFLPSPVITQRQRFASLNIEFLETNISFVDFLLRPWAVLGSHFGSVARKMTPITTDVMVMNLARAGTSFGNAMYDNSSSGGAPGVEGDYRTANIHNSRGFIPRKVWYFQGCQPINIDSQRHSYNQSSDVERRTVEWMFRRYQIYMPSSFEDLFTTVDKIDEQGKTSQYLKDHSDEYKTRNDDRSKKLAADAGKYWDGKDGDENPYDNSAVRVHKGDGIARSQEKYKVGKEASEKVLQDGSNAAFEYWAGNDVDPQVSHNLSWTINTDGKPVSPDLVYVPRAPMQSGGWDKDGTDTGGTARLGNDQPGKEKRPLGQKADNVIDAISKNKTMAENYGTGEVDWNPYLNELEPNAGNAPIDPATAINGGSYGPDGGNRYQMDAIEGQFKPARPYGSNRGMPQRHMKMITGNYARGMVRWNPYLNKSIAPVDPGKYAMGGFYGADGGYRYQVDTKKGKIQPVGRGASAYTGNTDLLRIIFGI